MEFIEAERLSDKLRTWYLEGSEKGMNVITLPFRGAEPIEAFIVSVLAEGGRVLYITGEDLTDACIYASGEKAGVTVGDTEDSSLVIMDFERALLIHGNYDLIVYDDINSVPIHNRLHIMSLINTIHNRCRKFLAFSIEKVFRSGDSYFVPCKEKGLFITEPRFINSRLDIREVIPKALFDFIMFFQEERRKVVILCPEESSRDSLIAYLERVSPAMASSIVIGDETDDVQINRRAMEDSPLLVFLTEIRGYCMAEENFDFIVIDAENRRFSYREYIYLAQRASIKDRVNGELLLVSSDAGENMTRTRDITREFNRILWENNYFA